MYAQIKKKSKLSATISIPARERQIDSYIDYKSAATVITLEIEEKAYTEGDIWVITKKR